MKNKRLKELIMLASNLELSIKAINSHIDCCWRRWEVNKLVLARLQRRKELNWISRWLEDIFYGTDESSGQDLDTLFEQNQQKEKKYSMKRKVCQTTKGDFQTH